MPSLRQARRRGLVCLLLGAAGTACARGPGSGVSDSAFVATMAELRRVQREPATDSAARAAARARVLKRRGLTAVQLEQAARALAADPDRANKVFQAIARKTGAGSDGAGQARPWAAGDSAAGDARSRLRGGRRRARSPTR